MNRKEVIDNIAKITGENKVSVNQFLEAFINTIQSTVASGENVTLSGFGSFKPIHNDARMGRNLNGEVIHINAKVKPKFVPSVKFKALVDRLNAK